MSEQPLESDLWKLDVELDLDAKLTALRADYKFLKAIEGTAREAAANWHVSLEEARRTVLSGLGEPNALEQVHGAWITGKTALAKLILRRRMLDRFGEDARRPNHRSLAPVEDGDVGLGRFGADTGPSPFEQLAAGQVVECALDALACFAAKGDKQHDQADLLRRYFSEETPSAQLSAELACSQVALRVRVCKALKALRKHIRKYHPEVWSDDAVAERRGGSTRPRRGGRAVRGRAGRSPPALRTSARGDRARVGDLATSGPRR